MSTGSFEGCGSCIPADVHEQSEQSDAAVTLQHTIDHLLETDDVS